MSADDCTVCAWEVDEDGLWDTECNEEFQFIEAGPTENKFVHCPFCGRKLIETQNN